MLYNLAGAKSYRTAITNQRDEIALLLTPNQLDEAQELASKWKIGMPIPNTTKTYPLTSKAQRRKK
jgi:predicted methyltransferase MtxX (methanogen marker protein 4)